MKIFVCSADDTERIKVEFCGNKDELLIFTERMRKAIEVESDKLGGVVEMRISDELVSDVVVINATNTPRSKTSRMKDIIIAVLIMLAALALVLTAFVFQNKRT